MPDLEDGESIEIQGSAAKPYVIKNVGGLYSCTCPAWRNQSTAIERRTCKHIRKLRGEAAENQRLGGELPARAIKEKDGSDGPPLLLAQAWDSATDLSDWWMSEKLDGVRAYWDGKQFVSRLGNTLHAPDWFAAGLPNAVLDGELWIARKAFQKTVSIVRRQDKSDHWKAVRYLVFDAPGRKKPFESRMDFLKDCVATHKLEYAALHEHQRCKSLAHLREELARVESLGGEGLMLRQPGSNYEVGRSFTLLKVKTFHDAEAVVVDYQGGKGKHKGKLGSLVVQLADGTEFSVGTGLSDAERAAPPPIGSKITFRYQELSDGGVPRFPSFVRVHESSSVKANATKAARTKAAPARREGEAPAEPQSTEKSTKTAQQELRPPIFQNAASEGTRYFEFTDGKSNKFWKISNDGLNVTVRYGRIGTNGQTQTKSFANEAAADKHTSKLIDEKTEKGYVESDRPDT